jgi:hypothetical protein
MDHRIYERWLWLRDRVTTENVALGFLVVGFVLIMILAPMTPNTRDPNGSTPPPNLPPPGVDPGHVIRCEMTCGCFVRAPGY